MSRIIDVTTAEGESDYVTVEFKEIVHKRLAGPRGSAKGQALFFLSSGEELVLESAERFSEPHSEDSYYVSDDADKEWLITLQ
ncbi:hypothetical protein [Vreelandella sp. GE22]